MNKVEILDFWKYAFVQIIYFLYHVTIFTFYVCYKKKSIFRFNIFINSIQTFQKNTVSFDLVYFKDIK